MSGNLLQLKLFKGLPGWGMFFLICSFGGGGGIAGGGQNGAAGGGGGAQGGGGGAHGGVGGVKQVSNGADFKLIT